MLAQLVESLRERGVSFRLGADGGVYVTPSRLLSREEVSVLADLKAELVALLTDKQQSETAEPVEAETAPEPERRVVGHTLYVDSVTGERRLEPIHEGELEPYGGKPSRRAVDALARKLFADSMMQGSEVEDRRNRLEPPHLVDRLETIETDAADVPRQSRPAFITPKGKGTWR
jgi:hypothetical protein